MTAVVPNTTGARLLTCAVQVEKSPPTVSTRVWRTPIFGFVAEEDGSLTPLLLSGPAKFWKELRTSVNGAHVRAVEVPGVGIAKGQGSFEDEAAFVAAAASEVTYHVAEVRRAKGWGEETIPPPPPIDEDYVGE